MSVKDMARMLGLRKTDSYYLIHKGFFEVVEFNGEMRVLIESFENWYNSQHRYIKVDGPEPRGNYGRSFSLEELAGMLGLTKSGARYLVSRKLFKSEVKEGLIRISRRSFEAWYKTQFRYWKVNGPAPGSKYPPSISPSEISYMFELPLRNTIYSLLKNHPEIKTFTVDRMTRVDLASFNEWYSSQTHYQKIHEEAEDGYDCETEE